MKFRKKPVIIEAEQFIVGADGSVPSIDGVMWSEEVMADYDGTKNQAVSRPYVDTLEGKLWVSDKDWIITGIKGEKYPCKPDIFEATYEKVEDK